MLRTLDCQRDIFPKRSSSSGCRRGPVHSSLAVGSCPLHFRPINLGNHSSVVMTTTTRQRERAFKSVNSRRTAVIRRIGPYQLYDSAETAGNDARLSANVTGNVITLVGDRLKSTHDFFRLTGRTFDVVDLQSNVLFVDRLFDTLPTAFQPIVQWQRNLKPRKQDDSQRKMTGFLTLWFS